MTEIVIDWAKIRKTTAEILSVSADRGLDFKSLKVDIIPQFRIKGTSTTLMGPSHVFELILDEDYHATSYVDVTAKKEGVQP